MKKLICICLFSNLTSGIIYYSSYWHGFIFKIDVGIQAAATNNQNRVTYLVSVLLTVWLHSCHGILEFISLSYQSFIAIPLNENASCFHESIKKILFKNKKYFLRPANLSLLYLVNQWGCTGVETTFPSSLSCSLLFCFCEWLLVKST